MQLAIQTFGKLGDRIIPDIGYVGKDLTALPLFMDILGIQEKEIFVETIIRLDERIIRQSQERVKREREKLSKKAK